MTSRRVGAAYAHFGCQAFSRIMMNYELSDDLALLPVLPLRRHEQARAAVVALFRERTPGGTEALQALSPREWKSLLHWLDTSGLALYFFDRLQERGLLGLLPLPITRRLECNLLDNTQRTACLLEECCAIQQQFATAGVCYSVLKGISLWPYSVPRLELRSQLDLDFLIDAKHEGRAKAVLEARGYRLQAISGRSREFKTPYTGSLSLADLYRPSAQRTVELHLEEQGSGLLDRCEHHSLREVSMPVLSAADLFLDQTLHLYKHLSRDQMRTSHMIELYRHLMARTDDHAFWIQVENLCAGSPTMAPCVGVALDFVSQQMDPSCVPAAVRRWTIDRVPLPARLWVRRYGPRVTVASFPGTKLHLLLQEAMAHEGVLLGRSIGSSLLPRHLPPPIAISPTGETASQALRRELRQVRFVLIRLRFHVREGLRYLRERRCWTLLLENAGGAPRERAEKTVTRLPARSVSATTKP